MNTQELCTQCYQGITNPVCTKCHTKQLALWLNDNCVNPKIIFYIIRKIKKDFVPNCKNRELCILCNKEILSLCTYCYFFKIENALNSLNFAESSIEKFLEIFNYNLFGDKTFSLEDYKGN